MKVKPQYIESVIEIRVGRRVQKIRPQDMDELDLYNHAINGHDFYHMFEGVERREPDAPKTYQGIKHDKPKKLKKVEDMTYKELKNAFPHVEARSKKAFLEKLIK